MSFLAKKNTGLNEQLIGAKNSTINFRERMFSFCRKVKFQKVRLHLCLIVWRTHFIATCNLYLSTSTVIALNHVKASCFGVVLEDNNVGKLLSIPFNFNTKKNFYFISPSSSFSLSRVPFGRPVVVNWNGLWEFKCFWWTISTFVWGVTTDFMMSSLNWCYWRQMFQIPDAKHILCNRRPTSLASLDTSITNVLY